MTSVWLTIGVLAIATAVIRAAGPLLVGGRDLPGPARRVVALVAPALLAALVVVETVGAPAGGEIVLDARLAGVAAAGGALVLGVAALPVVLLAALVTALARLIA